MDVPFVERTVGALRLRPRSFRCAARETLADLSGARGRGWMHHSLAEGPEDRDEIVRLHLDTAENVPGHVVGF